MSSTRAIAGLAAILVLAFLVPNGPERAVAGVNLDGTLVLHAEPQLVFTYGQDFSGSGNLSDCSAVVDSVDALGTCVAFAMAVFPTEEPDRLTGLTFGVSYDPAELTIAGYGTNCDFELPNADWPEPNSGTALTWTVPRSGRIVEAYWFAAYSNYGAPATLPLAAHPAQGGTFADSGTPAVLDDILPTASSGSAPAAGIPCPPPAIDLRGQLRGDHRAVEVGAGLVVRGPWAIVCEHRIGSLEEGRMTTASWLAANPNRSSSARRMSTGPPAAATSIQAR
ncbi:MAG: hypothetical protein R3E97_11935 [Candidatus Eisenbacteria bacterium]